jgi:hypothetical protein
MSSPVPPQAVHLAEITFGFDFLARIRDLISLARGLYPIMHPAWLPVSCDIEFIK